MARKAKSIIGSDDVQMSVNAGNIGMAVPELREAGIEVEDIDVIPAHKARNKIEEARFMEEMVVVEIEADDDPNAPEFVYSGHQGVSQYIKRGVAQPIKRKYLYSLLSAKRIKFACAFGKNDSGNEFNRLNPSGQTAHRVRLVQDNNPQGGMKWFQSVMAAA